MNPEPKETQSTVDNSRKSEDAASDLSEDQKKQLQMQSDQQHEQGPAREKSAQQADEIDGKK